MERFFKVVVKKTHTSEVYIATDEELEFENDRIKYIELSSIFSEVLEDAVLKTLEASDWDEGEVEIGTITELYNNEFFCYNVYDYDYGVIFDIEDYKFRLSQIKDVDFVVPLKPAKTQMELDFND